MFAGGNNTFLHKLCKIDFCVAVVLFKCNLPSPSAAEDNKTLKLERQTYLSTCWHDLSANRSGCCKFCVLSISNVRARTCTSAPFSLSPIGMVIFADGTKRSPPYCPCFFSYQWDEVQLITGIYEPERLPADIICDGTSVPWMLTGALSLISVLWALSKGFFSFSRPHWELFRLRVSKISHGKREPHKFSFYIQQEVFALIDITAPAMWRVHAHCVIYTLKPCIIT